MRHTLATLLYVLGCVLLTLGAVSCVSDEQIDATADLISTIQTANADGVLTLDEKSVIEEKAARLADAKGIDWSTVGATLVTGGMTALLAAFPALRLILPVVLQRIPNEQILGTKPDPAVAMAAGLAVTKP